MARGVLHHVSLEVSDIARARYFYDRFLVPMGIRRFVAADSYLGYTDGEMTIWLLRSPKPRIHRTAPSGEEEVVAEHLAFRLPSADDVRSHEADLARAELYPIFRGEEHPEFRKGYFSASWVDPDGIVLELYAFPSRRAAPKRGARPPRKRPRGSTRPVRRAKSRSSRSR